MDMFNASLQGARADTYTPWGSTTWERTPGADGENDSWVSRQTLAPEQQQLYDSGVQSQLSQADLLGTLAERANQTVGSGFDTSSLPGMATTPEAQRGQVYQQSFNPGDLSGISERTQGRSADLQSGLAGFIDQLQGMNPQAFNDQASDALYGTNTRYMDPQFEREQRLMEGRLGEQGFVPGTPAYDNQMDQFRQSKERAYADARDRSTTLGSQVGSQQFGNQRGSIQDMIAAALSGGSFGLSSDQTQAGLQAQDFGQQVTQQQAGRQGAMDANQVAEQLFSQNLQGGAFQNQSRQQSLAEMLALRSLPFNELAAVRGGTQVQQPNTQAQYSVPGLGAPDQLGAAGQQHQNELGAWNSQTASDNQLMQGLASMAMLFMASDRRIKRNLVRRGTTPGGLPIYAYSYVWGGPRYVGVMAQDALLSQPDAVGMLNGYLAVDYARIR